jgi:CRP/FNR family cyclic AMP-dependent transcriptional regulator
LENSNTDLEEAELFSEEEVPTFDELMSGLSDDQVEILSSYTEKEEYVPGETIFYENEPGETIYIIQSGSVEISKMNETEDDYIPFVTLKPGNIFGEMSFLRNSRTSATAVAQDHTVLYKIDRPSFREITSEYPDLACQIYQAISRILVYRLHRTDAKLTQMATENDLDFEKEMS